MTTTRDEILTWRGRQLCDRDGDKVGTIDEIYLDAQTEEPEWALVNVGLFGGKSTFVPLRDATDVGDEVRVPFEKALIKNAPSVEADGRLSQDEEAELYRHYDMPYSEATSDSGLPEGGAADSGLPERGAAGESGNGDGGRDDAMTRSEEELRVGTAERESGRVRLRKHVVTDEVTQTVPVRREEVRLEREPVDESNVDDATAGPEISEAEHEVVLHEEQPVVEKRAVPKERVRLGKDSETEQREVSEQVRKEQIEVDDGGRAAS